MYTSQVGTRTRAVRDPQTRRRTIIEAAATLILESGVTHLTHRKVAARAQVPLGSTTHYFASLDELRAEALQLLAADVDDSLATLRDELATADDPARTLARSAVTHLADPVRVRTDAAFCVASLEHPDLRPLATRWSQGLVAALSPLTDPATARSVARYLDGVMLHGALHETPPDEAELATAIARLLSTTHETL